MNREESESHDLEAQVITLKQKYSPLDLEETNHFICNYISLLAVNNLTHSNHISHIYDFLSTDYFSYNDEFAVRKLVSLLEYLVDNNEGYCPYVISAWTYNNVEETYLQSVLGSIDQNLKIIRVIGDIFSVCFRVDVNKVLPILKDCQFFEIVNNLTIDICNLTQMSQANPEFEGWDFFSLFSGWLSVITKYLQLVTLSEDQLDLINVKFLELLISDLEVEDIEINSNFIELELILSVNEQYMARYCQDSSVENKIFNLILRDHSLFDKMSGILLVNFNRIRSSLTKILSLKFLYLTFTTSLSCEFWYLNDLRVLMDIFLREIESLSIAAEGPLVLTYLKVFLPMLMFTALKHNRYKEDQLLDCLQYMITCEDATEPISKASVKIIKFLVGGQKTSPVEPPTPVIEKDELDMNTVYRNSPTRRKSTSNLPNLAERLYKNPENQATSSLTSLQKKKKPPLPPVPRMKKSSRLE